MSHTRLAAVALTATTLAASGCGGSTTKSQSANSTNAGTSAGQPATTPQPPTRAEAPARGPRLTRAELIAKADAICARLNRQAGSVRNTSLRGVGSTAPLVAGYFRAAFAELRRLTPPAAMARDWKAIVSDIQPVAGEVVIMGKYASDNDPASTAKVESRIARVQLHRIAIAKRNGFRDCAEL
jgi:hypothetical protein